VRVGESIISLSVKDAPIARCISRAPEELGVNILRLPTVLDALAYQYLQAGWLGQKYTLCKESLPFAYSRSASLTIGLTTSSHHAFSSRPLVRQCSAFLNIFFAFLRVYSNSARAARSRLGSERSRVAVLLNATGFNLWKPMSVSALTAS
jgi:hypothetical protein